MEIFGLVFNIFIEKMNMDDKRESKERKM